MTSIIEDAAWYADDKYFYWDSNYNLETIPELVAKHPKTIKRWHENNAWPLWAKRLIASYSGYYLHPGWHGWRLNPRDFKLYPPGLRHGFTAPEIEGLDFIRQNLGNIRHSEMKPKQYELLFT